LEKPLAECRGLAKLEFGGTVIVRNVIVRCRGHKFWSRRRRTSNRWRTRTNKCSPRSTNSRRWIIIWSNRVSSWFNSTHYSGWGV